MTTTTKRRVSSQTAGIALKLTLAIAFAGLAVVAVALAVRQRTQQKSVQASQFSANMGLLDKTSGDDRARIREQAVEYSRDHLDELIKTLDSVDQPMPKRAEAALAISLLGDRGNKAAPTLIKTADSTDKVLKRNSLQALGRMSVDPATVLPVLVKSLSFKDSLVRYRAAFALGRVHGSTPESIAALQKACSDHDKRVRQAAVNSLATLGQPPGPSKSDEPPPPPDPQ